MKPVLSVCMMVKNEEENLERCLRSLKPLLEAMASELIIVDTGSTDQTVDIAKRYTDKIFFREWNNDFSGMRNISMSYAQGKWILIIDADEELHNPLPIKGFIEGKKPANVVAGALKLINVKKNDKDRVAATLMTPRVFLNNGKFRYEGIVHNIPVVEGYTQEISCELYHYGYNADDKDLMEKKFERTSKLLITALEKDPNNIYYRFQLSVTYHMHGEYAKALIEIMKAYELIKDSEPEKNRSPYVYPQLIKCYIMNSYYDQALKMAEEALLSEPENFDLYFFKAQAQLLIGQDQSGIDSYLRYLSLLQRYHELDIRLNLKVQTLSNTLESQCEAYHNLAVTYNKLQDYKNAYTFTTKFFHNEAFRYVESHPKTFLLHMELCSRFEKYDEIAKLLRKIDDAALKETLIELVESKNYGRKIEISSKLSKIEGDYGDLNRLRYESATGAVKSIDKVTKYLNNDLLLKPAYWFEIVYFALGVNSDVASLLATWSETDIIRAFNTLDETYEDMPKVLLSHISALDGDNSFKQTNLRRVSFKYLAYKHTHHQQEDHYCEAYLQAALHYIRLKYGNQFIAIGENMAYLSEEERFLMNISTILVDFDSVNVYRRLGDIQGKYPYMEVFRNYLLRIFSMEGKEHDPMAKLETELIAQVAVLMRNDDCDSADEILRQAMGIMPESKKLHLIQHLVFLESGKRGY